MRVTPASDPGQSSNAAPARKKAGGNCFLPAFSAQRPTRAPRKPSRQWREMIRKGPGAVHFSGSRMHLRSARGSVQAARSADGPRLRRRARARISLRSLRRLRRLRPPTKPRFDSALVGASRPRAARTDRGSVVAAALIRDRGRRSCRTAPGAGPWPRWRPALHRRRTSCDSKPGG